MKNIFAVGTGPGAAEYLTLQAADVIKNAGVIFAPDNKGKHAALDTARPLIENKKIILVNFPMGNVKPSDYKTAAEIIITNTPPDGSGVFLTIGDPLIYSTFIYLMPYFENREDINLKIISGIPSFVAAAGKAKRPLTKKGETLILADNFCEDILKNGETAVILKTAKGKQNIIEKLENNDFDYSYIKKLSMKGELILNQNDKEKILADQDYLSLIIANKK